MAYGIDDTFELTKEERRALAGMRIRTSGELLYACCDEQGLRRVALGTGISPERLRRWTVLADLMRINGVGPQFAELLVACGVTDVRSLSAESTTGLAARLTEKNAEHRLSRVSPGTSLVDDWIQQARDARPLLDH